MPLTFTVTTIPSNKFLDLRFQYLWLTHNSHSTSSDKCSLQKIILCNWHWTIMSPCCYLSKQTGVKIIGYFYLVSIFNDNIIFCCESECNGIHNCYLLLQVLILLTITFIIFLLTIFGIASAKIDFEASNFTTNGRTINKSAM